MVELRELAGALGCSPKELRVQALIGHLQVDDSTSGAAEPEIKSYPDVVYHNYRALGLSLQCE